MNSQHKQYKLVGSELILKVKKAPILITGILYFLALSFVVAPFIGITLNFLDGEDFHIGFVLGIVFFLVSGLYLMRIALWNSFGKEELIFDDFSFTYRPDYGLFKGRIKVFKMEILRFDINKIGYEEDGMGQLKIVGKSDQLNCVVKIPIQEIEILNLKLKSSFIKNI